MNTHYEDIARPHGRDLTENELQAVACQIAARQELWSEHVSHDAGAPDLRRARPRRAPRRLAALLVA